MKTNRRATQFLFFSFLLLSFLMACLHTDESGEDTTGTGLCHELAGSQYLPVSLGKLLALGRDSSGNLLVADKSDNTMRVFISRNDTLHRIKVSGSSVNSQLYYNLSLESRNRLIFQNDGEWRDVYLCKGVHCRECDSILTSKLDRTDKSNHAGKMEEGWRELCNYLDSARPDCQAMTGAEAADVKAFFLMNFPPTTQVEYLARLADSNTILVSREEYDWNGDVVVHYGKPGSMQLRTVISFLRATDGGSTWITFRIGTEEATAYFGVRLDSSGFHPGSANLRMNGDTLDFERLEPDKDRLIDLGFDCTHEVR